MGCNCGNTDFETDDISIVKKDEEYIGKTKPLDQCLFCAQKHCQIAMGSYFEYKYEKENRNWIMSNLRAIVGHTFRANPDIADKARDLCLILQNNDDNAETDQMMLDLMELIDNRLYQENPELQAKLNALNNK